ncbi:MAG: ribonucleoside triphosphate reductase [Candidatus Aenigmarchaeota archaeon]|nr:ribonucleoside triphosphate reductase [Candidatus Aenigmarchaeota archaeon]
MITKIRKRDGRVVKFDQNKITNAIWAAAQAIGGTDRKLSEKLSDEVVKLLNEKYDGKIPTVENIQDIVEKVLVENGHYKTAKAYILYREEHKKLRDVKSLLLNVGDVVDSYMKQADWRSKENANIGYSYSGMLWHGVGTIMAYYALNHVYPKEIAKPHIEGEYHLHDLSMSLAGYCAGWSIRQILIEGFNGVPGRVESGPAKHLRSALGQLVNFIGTLQNEWAGAQALSSFDTYLAPFVRKDNLRYEQVKQAIQEYVFGMNTTSRWGGQCPFSNITLDWTVPEDIKDDKVIIGGKQQKDTYADYQDEMDMINKAFIEVMTEGDMNGRVFTWPIPTYNITRDFDWDSENAQLLFNMTSKFGIPYFQNFVNSDLKPSDVRAMCCRLQLNLKELRHKTGGLFGFGESTGSIGVVTINLPRIGYLAKDETEFFERLERLMYLAKNSLELKRKIVTRNFQMGLLPFSKRYLGHLNHHFSTIGLVGMNEACLNFLGEDITTPEGKAFAEKVLDFMRNKITEYQEETGHIYNLEATPAEGTSYRLARIDKKKYPKIITQGKKVPYYTNSSQLPVGFTNDVFAALKHQESLQRKYTGGTVFHTFLGESLGPNGITAKLVKKIAYNFKIPYYTITPTFSFCQDHGYIKGEHFKCPTCGKPTEVYSRVVGYIRPVSHWNEGKQEEFKERRTFVIDKNVA